MARPCPESPPDRFECENGGRGDWLRTISVLHNQPPTWESPRTLLRQSVPMDSLIWFWKPDVRSRRSKRTYVIRSNSISIFQIV